MALPLKPPIKPQLAVRQGTARGRRLALRAEVGRLPHARLPRRRRGPPAEPRRQADEPLLPGDREAGARDAATRVLDGEIIIDGRRHPGVRPAQPADPPGGVAGRDAGRRDPASFVAFDVLADGDESLLELPYDERRERRPPWCGTGRAHPGDRDRDGAGQWLTGTSEGVVAKEGGASYLPGERKGMVKIKRVRTADVVVAAFRFGKEEGTVGSLILGLYDEEASSTSSATPPASTRSRSASCSSFSSPTAQARRARASRAAGSPTRISSGRACGRSSSARSRSTTSPDTASATAPSSCAGATTRTRGVRHGAASQLGPAIASPPCWGCALPAFRRAPSPASPT